jgi:peroxiredoxin
MQQVVDLQNSPEFQSLDVGLLSIAFDPVTEMAPEVESLGITVPMLSDTDHSVSKAYDVLQWAIASGEPGHTFVLVDERGELAWIRDYGSPENAEPTMYVDPREIVEQVRAALGTDRPDY